MLMSEQGDGAEFAKLVTSLSRHLQRRQRIGVRFVPQDDLPKTGSVMANNENLLSGTAGDLFSDAAAAFQAKSLEELRAAIGDCRRCKLWPGRTHLVFGVGNRNAKLMCIGEGPGRDEDLQGEPFIGRTGQLLTDIITKGMGFRREDVYIANVVKCRPPENRNPEPDEVASCEPFLKKQIDLVRPEIIVALASLPCRHCCKRKLQLPSCGAIGTVIMESN